MEKNLIVFDLNKNVKILLQKIDGVDYSKVKANGPFEKDQNILEIIDGNDEKDIDGMTNSYFNENNNDKNDNDIITVQKKENKNQDNIYSRKKVKNFIFNEIDEVVEENNNKNDSLSFLDKMKIEQILLTKEYKFVESKDNNFLILMLVEILDKIYIIKIFLFLSKYEILFLYLSIYLFHHIILVNILAMFFDIKTIKNIWNKENYPGFGLCIGYGLASCVITWVIYIIFICSMNSEGRFNQILIIKKSKKFQNKTSVLEKMCFNFISKTKMKIIIYSIIQFILIIFFFIYLITLCAVYTGTGKKIFISYGIAILEIIIIKIVYGLVLAILRYVSLSIEKEGLYNFVLFMDKYIV